MLELWGWRVEVKQVFCYRAEELDLEERWESEDMQLACFPGILKIIFLNVKKFNVQLQLDIFIIYL